MNNMNMNINIQQSCHSRAKTLTFKTRKDIPPMPVNISNTTTTTNINSSNSNHTLPQYNSLPQMNQKHQVLFLSSKGSIIIYIRIVIIIHFILKRSDPSNQYVNNPQIHNVYSQQQMQQIYNHICIWIDKDTFGGSDDNGSNNDGIELQHQIIQIIIMMNMLCIRK